MSEVTPRIASDELLQCDITRRAEEAQAGSQTGFPLITRFPGREDVKNAYMMLQDYTRQFFPQIPYKKLLTIESEIDSIHGEIQEQNKRWADIIQLRTFVVPSKIIQPLTGFGIEDQRTIELLVAVPDLLDSALVTQDENFDVKLLCRIGDHFFYHNREYDINSIVPAAFFGNTDVVLYFKMSAELFRGRSPDQWGVVEQ